MADESDSSDKTHDPTQKRLDDAHDRGDVAKSQEINTWFVIAGGTLVLSTFSGSVGGGIMMPMRNLIANSWMVQTDGPGLLQLAQSLGYILIAALGIPFLMLALAAIAGNMILHLMGAVVAMLALVAIADYLFQYRQWFERQKMSLQEMKEEFKQSEGDPHVKGRIRQLRQARMKKRMMAAVPKASVIITNPTHYSVALAYERGMSAPICVAKGVDTLALKIREVAGEHDIPIVENVPLARALYATVDVDDEIPVEHYHAVAETIGYVMGLKRGLSGWRA